MKVELTKGYLVRECLDGQIVRIFDTKKSAENYIEFECDDSNENVCIEEYDIIIYNDTRASVVTVSTPYEYSNYKITDDMILEKIRVAAFNKLTTQEIEVLGLKR